MLGAAAAAEDAEAEPPVPASEASSEPAAAAAVTVTTDYGSYRDREPELPKFDGKSTKAYRTYKKKLQIWLRLTQIPREKRALKIVTGLEDEAWDAVEDLDFGSLETEHGPRVVEVKLDELMGIREENEIMKVIDDFYFADGRRDSEDVKTYLNRMRQALTRLKAHSVEPPAAVAGRILLRHACLADEDESLVLTAAQQSLEYAAVERAMVSIWGQDGRRPRRRDRVSASAKRGYVAEEDGGDEEEDEGEDEEDADAMAAFEDGSSGTLSEDEAQDIFAAWKAARERLNKKKQDRKFQAEGVRRFRGTLSLQELQKRTRCRRCHKKGHWKRDCPQREAAGSGNGGNKNPGNDKSGKKGGGGGGNKDGARSSGGAGFFALAEPE